MRRFFCSSLTAPRFSPVISRRNFSSVYDAGEDTKRGVFELCPSVFGQHRGSFAGQERYRIRELETSRGDKLFVVGILNSKVPEHTKEIQNVCRPRTLSEYYLAANLFCGSSFAKFDLTRCWSTLRLNSACGVFGIYQCPVDAVFASRAQQVNCTSGVRPALFFCSHSTRT
jgi:hypothetical protein